MKYRIKKETMADGTEDFYVQERIFLFFYIIHEKRISPFTYKSSFRTYEEAEEYVDMLIKLRNRHRVVKRETVREFK